MYKHIAPHHIIPPHFTLHHSTSNTVSDIIPNHTTFHVRPSFLTITHISYRTNTSIPLCNTIFQIALYRPHYASHHISHCTQFHITYHIMPHFMYSTAHFRSRHILATSCIAPHFQDNIAPHFTCRSISCIIASFHLI